MFISSFPPEIEGIANYTFNMCRELAKLGHTISVAAPYELRFALKDALSWKEFPRLSQVQVYRIWERRPLIIRINKVVQFLAQALRLLLQNRPDIVDIQYEPFSLTPPNLLIPFILACKILRMHVILSVQETAFAYKGKKIPFRSRSLYLFWEKIVLFLASKVHFFGHYEVNMVLGEYPWIGYKTIVIPMGLNLVSNFSSHRKKVIFFWGHVSKDKGLHHLFLALPKVVKCFPEMRVKIIGDFSLRPSYFNYLVSLGRDLDISGNVDFLGMLPLSEISEVVAESQVAVLPYQRSFSSGAIYNVMGFGLPIVATNVGNFPEMIEDGSNGFLVSVKDVEALSDAIIKILGDPSLAERLSKAMEQRAKKYTWNIIAFENAKLYMQLLRR